MSVNLMGGSTMTNIMLNDDYGLDMDYKFDIFSLETDQDVFEYLLSSFRPTKSDLDKSVSELECNERVFFNQLVKTGFLGFIFLT